MSRTFIAEDFDCFDIIYAMSTDVIEEMKWIGKDQYDDTLVELLLNEAYPGQSRDIPDPWYGTEPDFHNVFKLIDSACDKIIEKYTVAEN